MIPTIILLCLSFYSLMNDLGKHGDTKAAGKVNFWTTVLSVTILWGLLWWAGIFENFSR